VEGNCTFSPLTILDFFSVKGVWEENKISQTDTVELKSVMLDKLPELIKKFIETIADNNFKWMKNFPLSSNKNKCLVLKELWVNYQKKLEFNPLHCHDGILSFILFIKIPYNIEDELKVAPGIDAVQNLAGHLQFACPNKGFFRSLETKSIPVDKKFEKKGLMFPALLYHTVYPFYKSEDLRITISGNLFLDDKTN